MLNACKWHIYLIYYLQKQRLNKLSGLTYAHAGGRKTHIGKVHFHKTASSPDTSGFCFREILNVLTHYNGGGQKWSKQIVNKY